MTGQTEQEIAVSNLLRDNRLPIAISVTALVVATIIGIIPTLENTDATARTGGPDVAALEARIASLEAMVPASAIPALPANADNARLRQEVDIINRGLANQTGRVSRLKKTVNGIVGENGQVIMPSIVADEISLAKRGLVNLTRRLNNLEDRMDALDTAAADINRLQLQMQNVDRAFIRIQGTITALQDQADTPPSAATNSAPKPNSFTEVQAIEAKLDAILQALQD